MSEDLIKRSDAIEAIELVDWYHQNRNKDIVSGANSREHQAWYKAEDIYKALEAVPTIEPQTERSGVLFRGELEEGDYKLIKTTNGWVLEGNDIAYYGEPQTERSE